MLNVVNFFIKSLFLDDLSDLSLFSNVPSPIPLEYMIKLFGDILIFVFFLKNAFNTKFKLVLIISLAVLFSGDLFSNSSLFFSSLSFSFVSVFSILSSSAFLSSSASSIFFLFSSIFLSCSLMLSLAYRAPFASRSPVCILTRKLRILVLLDRRERCSPSSFLKPAFSKFSGNNSYLSVKYILSPSFSSTCLGLNILSPISLSSKSFIFNLISNSIGILKSIILY